MLILGAVGGGLYLWWTTSEQPRLATTASEGLPEEPSTTPDPLRADRDEIANSARPGRSPRPGKNTQAALSEVTLIGLHAKTRQPLRGFVVRLEAAGSEAQTITVESDRQIVLLGPGTYTAHATRPDCEALDPSEFQVPEAGTATTHHLLFRPFEAFLRLSVLDRASREALPRFRATVQSFAEGSERGQTEFLPNQQQQPLVLPAKVGERLLVQVEAEGYIPIDPIEITFDGSQREVVREVSLSATAPYSGIELRVTDLAQRPIPRLNIVARDLNQGDTGSRGAGKILWNRVWDGKLSKDGHYRVPDLQPGTYQLDLTSVHTELRAHQPTLHLTHSLTIEYFEGQHIVRPVTLQPGAMLELRVTDLTGEPIGKDVAVEVRQPDGTVREVIWHHVSLGKSSGHNLLGRDTLTRNAPARLYRCLPGGQYTLKLRWGGGQPAVRTVHLTNGEIRVVEVQLGK